VFVVASPLEKVCKEVLKRVTPSENETKKVLELAKKLTKKVRQEIQKRKLDAEVRVEGSVAKNTWLKDAPEIDVFMRFSTTTPREHFETVCLDIAKQATKDGKQIERYAEHPYLEAVIDGVYVNIVPCYRVKRGKWLSSTDRTPFHTDYVKPLLDEKAATEVRLLKRFMKGVGVYGAEIKVGGFSGYLCELLVLNYGSFAEVLCAASGWKERTVIDCEKQYKTESDVKKAFAEPFVVVDPVDKGRNVAAAVRKDRLDEFVAASREFLKSPDLKFFYPAEVEALKPTKLAEVMESRGSKIVFVKFEGALRVPDVLWGQLYRSQKAIQKMISQHDFVVLRDTVWSDEENFHIFVFEVENRSLPNMKKHLGPPLKRQKECEKFLRKHLGADSTVSGPRLEEGRWVVDVKRDYVDVVDLLEEKLKDGGRGVGVAELVSDRLSESMTVFVKDELLKVYSAYPEFAQFLTLYLSGKPRWLT
jgi:tRNA nucleotidyltransferase (CCA-adding enzyme)